MLLVKGHVGDVDRRGPDILEFLLKLEEAVLDLLLNVLR